MSADQATKDPEQAIEDPASRAWRYRAFISYSHRDKDVASWLHRRLEHYRVPAKLVGTVTAAGPVPRRLTPLFRDRDELPASADLNTMILAALEQAQFLLVICSPASARSPWVDREIMTFKALHGEKRVLAVIASGEPYASLKPETAHLECFPPSLRYKVIDGALSTEEAEPIAADLRPRTDGKRLATFKLIAGLTGLPLDNIVQREAQRRMRRLVALSSASALGMVVTGGLAIYANARRVEANQQREIAERESATARATADFLIGTFKLSDPETENPKTITAQTILERGAQRARMELAGEPIIQSRLINVLGQAYNNLSLYDDARKTIEQSLLAINKAGAEGAGSWQTLADTYMLVGRLRDARAALSKSQGLLGPNPADHQDLRARAAITEGRIDTAEGRTSQGIAAFRRALAIYAANPATPPEKTATALQNLGLLLSDDQQFAAAERALNEALTIRRRMLGEQHLETGSLWYSLAQNAFLAGNLDAAQVDIEKAIAIEKHVLEPDSKILADSYSIQGQIFHGQRKLGQARASLDKAISIYRKAFGGPHYLIGIAQIYLALVESDQGHVSAALATLDEAKRNYDASYGRLHPNHGDLLVNRATILAMAGRMPEARRDCAAGLDILDRTLGAKANYTLMMAKTCAGLGS